jgi:pyruvate dehydrogenase E2 component (dihydrolipoamide acetyltransferase)
VAAALRNRPSLTAAARAAAGTAPFPASGSGIGGRLTLADLAAAPQAPAQSPAEPLVEPGEGAITETPVKGIRKVISDRMFRSLAESAQFTLNMSAPVSRLQDLRARLKNSAGLSGEPGLADITVNDFILFAVSRTLPRYPFMNAHKTGDTLKTFERVHLGLAVDTPRGLMVPVIRSANLLSLGRISSEAKRLAAACRDGSVQSRELSGSTFTVSNLGGFGVSGFTPILNAPEVAILGVCGIALAPAAAENGEGPVRFEPRIGFSLTINHQAVDGAPAARFLKALCGAVADIDLLLAAS